MRPPGEKSDGIVAWIGWHVGELAGVAVPGVIALTVTPWAAVASLAVAAMWTAHEMRSVRRQRAARTNRVASTTRSTSDAPTVRRNAR